MEKINKLSNTDRFIVANHFENGNPFAAANHVRSRLGINGVDAEAVAEKIGQEEGVL